MTFPRLTQMQTSMHPKHPMTLVIHSTLSNLTTHKNLVPSIEAYETTGHTEDGMSFKVKVFLIT